MKFRVVKVGGFYYPQRKWLWMWVSISQDAFEYDERMHKPFSTLTNAVDFINSLVPLKKPYVVWKR